MTDMKDVFAAHKDHPFAIKEGRCVNNPIGCGKPVGSFIDEISAKEYKLSGLCQECQDIIFSDDEG